MAEEKRPVQPSLYRETQTGDYSLHKQESAPGVKKRAPGLAYMVIGLVFGVIGVARVITLIPAAWDIITGSEKGTLGLNRQQVAVGIVAGLLAVVCSEVGTRREVGKVVWLGMLGSVLGVFAVLVGAGLAVLLFTQS